MNAGRYLFSLLAGLFLSSGLFAQPEPVCLDFEELMIGTVFNPANGYAPGDVIFTEENVEVSVDPFHYPNGNTGFGSVAALPAPPNFALGNGVVLFSNNMNLAFNFSGAPGQMLGVAFAFMDEGGLENISINGGSLHILESFLQLPFQAAPGVTAQVIMLPGVVPPVGSVVLTGPVESLVVGGQELVLDNFCFLTETGNPDCFIADLSASVSPCNGDGQYFAEVDFFHENGSAAGFLLYLDGQLYGSWPYDELPVNIGPFPGDGTTLHEVVVVDAANPDCSDGVAFGPVDCTPSPCHIYDLFAETTPCENGQFYVQLNFQYQNVGGEGFQVVGNGNNYGAFEYGDLPVMIGPLIGDGTTVYEFVVKDFLHPDCQDFVVIDPVDCGEEPCEIFELVVEPGECNGEDQYNLHIDFLVQNPGHDYFEVYYGAQSLGVFPLANLPITIENFSDNGEAVVHIKVCISDQPDCCKVAEFESPCPGGDPCHIYDLFAETTPCENGQFYVQLNFQYQNVGGEGFQVVGNGNNYGAFEYGDLPVMIGPLIGDGTTVYEFVVKDILHPDCHDFVVIDPVDCGGEPCEIYELTVEPGECNGEGEYTLYIDFLVQNPGNNFFEVYYGTTNLGYFPLSSLPLTIENFSDNGEEVVHIKVCINDQPDCCKVAEFLQPCGSEESDVWPGDANSDNIANNIDLLNLGIAFGAIGPTRDIPSIEWMAWPSMNWVEEFPNGVNFKHADCDGTGSVDGGDIEAIELNYNETHGAPLPVQYSEGTPEDPPLFALLPPQGSVGPGDPIEVPIVLGNANHPVEDIYGIAFTLHFDPDLIDPSSVELVYPVSWMGAPGVNMILVDKKFVEEGIIDVALSRTDANSVSGFGEIMGFIGIIDDVLGKHELEIGFTKVRAITFNDEVIPLHFPNESILISSAKEVEPLAEGLTVFPNPAREEIKWSLSSNQQTDYAAIADLNGRVVMEQFGTSGALSLQGLPAGFYLLKVQAGGEWFVARFIRIGE